MGPAFTVLIPVFNAGPYLKEAVDSVIAQTCQNWELIIVNDGSTDDACVQFANHSDKRIKVLKQPNAGPSKACNHGLSVARGKYIAFLDQDDLWHPQKLERHLDAFEDHVELDLTFSWYTYIGTQGQELRLHPTRWTGTVEFEQLLADNVIGPTSTVAIRREAIDLAGMFDPAFLMSYDTDLHLRILRLKRSNAIAIPAVLARYRRHQQQMSRDWRALKANWLELLAKFEKVDPEAVRRVRKHAGTIMCHYLASVAYERRDFDGAIGELNEGFKSDPAGFLRSPRHWQALAACLAGRYLPRSVHLLLESMAGIQSLGTCSITSKSRSAGEGGKP